MILHWKDVKTDDENGECDCCLSAAERARLLTRDGLLQERPALRRSAEGERKGKREPIGRETNWQREDERSGELREDDRVYVCVCVSDCVCVCACVRVCAVAARWVDVWREREC